VKSDWDALQATTADRYLIGKSNNPAAPRQQRANHNGAASFVSSYPYQ